MDIALILALATKAIDLYAHLRQLAVDAGASDDQLAALDADYDFRIARRQVIVDTGTPSDS